MVKESDQQKTINVLGIIFDSRMTWGPQVTKALSMSTSITYEHTTVIYFSLHVILYPGVNHLIELQAPT